MAKSRGRKFAEITSPTSGVFDLTSVPTITNAKLQNSAMTLAGSSVSLGGTGVADTDALSEGSSNLYFTDARVQTFLGGGTLAGNVVVPDNRSIYVGSSSDFRIVHNTTNTQLVNATGALQITSNGGVTVTGATTFSSTLTTSTDASTRSASFVGNGIEVKHPTGASELFIGSHTGNDVKLAVIGANTFRLDTNGVSRFSIDTSGNITVAGSLTAQNLINIATDSTIQTTSSRQWATIKNTGTGAGDYSEMKISNDNDDYLILGSIGSGYTNANWASSSYVYANRELRIKSQQGIRFYSGGFDTNTHDYMILDSNGKLGIGLTSSLASTLNVNTEISVGPDSNNRGIINYSSNNLSFGTRQSSTNYFSTVNIKSGKVGIGESNPDASLHITSNAPIISFDESDASQEYRIGSYGGTFALRDETDSAYRFAVDGSGNFGIGTTSMSAKLDIVGGGTSAVPTLELNSSTSDTFNHAINAFNSNLTAGKNTIFMLGKEGSNLNSGYIGFKWNSAGSNSNAVTFGAWGSDNLMNLTTDGRLGIGTQTPASYDTNSAGISADLVVANSGHSGIVVVSGTSSDAGIFFGDGTSNNAFRGAVSYVNSQDRLYFKASGANKMILDGTDGHLGIGADAFTNNGGNKLSIDTGTNQYAVTSGTTQTGGALRLRGGDNAVLDFGLYSVNTWIQATDKVNLANGYNLSLNPNGGNVGIGVPIPYADLHIANGTSEWRTSHGSTNLYTSNTSWGGAATGDPQFYYGAVTGILVTNTDSGTTGPAKPGLTLYNNDATAGGWSPMLLFAKAESGSSPYKATMAGIYARAPLGTGNGDSWIDGELWFGTSGAATNGVRGRMVLEKEGHLRPAADNTYDLGTTSYRWRNVYTTDLHLSNKVPEGTVGTDGEVIDAGNDVDGTTGDWTIQEGAEDLYIINNSTGKKYKFNLTEV